MGKRCRILYCIDGCFLHRNAFRGCMYDSQTRSKHMRLIDKTYRALFKQDKLYEELNRKYFKRYYKGKPTKRYLRIQQLLKEGEGISVEDFEQLLVMR
ncbi:MAG: hypothetical protein LBG19_02465 [Prevotellaceae bacterium]|jgi:hypothetical protein|nr:hypothetical protein [Prevotellaceae bacterium]